MKPKFKLKLLFLILGSLLFTVLFWKQNIGINYFVFNLFLSICLLLFYPNFLKSNLTKLTFFGNFLISIFIVIYGSVFSVVMYIISTILLIGTIQQPQIKLTFFLIISTINNYFNSFREILNEFTQSSNSDKNLKFNKLKRIFKIIIFPIIIFIVFFVIFKFANPVFAKYADLILINIGEFFTNIFKHFSFGQIFFTLWGLTIIATILYNFKTQIIKEIDNNYTENIFRKKIGKDKNVNSFFPKNNLNFGLKNEYRTALILVISINILIAIENIIDINSFWFGFEYDKTINMTQFVHEGTYLLILSILISMSLMIYYFRRNLNFYPKNKFLKYVNYAWIFQNIILTISVILRDYYYIYYYDLAYKRIGLIAFLILVIFGLITLFIKIKNQKTGYFLFRTNTWAVYILLVLMSLVNWDSYIANYNLNKTTNLQELDVKFILKLSEKTLPILSEHKEELKEGKFYNYYEMTNLDRKYNNFVKHYYSSSWQSWNYANYKAYKYFVNK